MITFASVDMVATGKRIKALREKSHISVAALSETLLVSPQAIFKWQRGEALPSIDNSLILSRVFDVHMEDLFVLEDDRSSPVFKDKKSVPIKIWELMIKLYDIIVSVFQT